jgi:anti-sigma regulatory factor (Ser/Thr protein kinase)
VTSAFHAELAPPSALDVLARRALAQLGGLRDVIRVGLAVSEGGRRQLLFTAPERVDATGVFEWCHIDPAADVPLNVAVRRGELVAGDLDELERRFPAFAQSQRDLGVEHVAAVPVTDEGEHLGGFVLYFDRPQRIDGRRRHELLAIGRTIGAQLTQARRDHRRSTAAVPDHDVEGGAGGAGGTLRTTYDMPGELHAVAGARRFLREALERCGVDPDLVGDAVLCLAELVTNAVVHTHAGCRVHVHLRDRVLSVRVVDHGGLGPVRLAPAADGITAHGRGLDIIRAIASRSGRDAARCVAWFELDVPG